MRTVYFLFILMCANKCLAQIEIHRPVEFTPDTFNEIDLYLKNWILKGNIKSIEIREHEPEWGSYDMRTNRYKELEDVPIEKTGRYEKYEFNQNGTLAFNIEGKIEWADNFHQKLEIDSFLANGGVKHYYNNADKLILTKRSDNYVKRFYDNENRIIKIVEGSETDRSVNHISLEYKYEYNEYKKTEYLKAPRFDTLFKLNKEYFYNAKRQLQELHENVIILRKLTFYHYDDSGRISAKEYHSITSFPGTPNDTLINSDTIRYNEQNLVSEFIKSHISQRGFNRLEKNIFKYNSSNLLIQELEYDYYMGNGSVIAKPIPWKLDMDHEIKYSDYDANNNPTSIYHIYTFYHDSFIQGPELVRMQKIHYTYY